MKLASNVFESDVSTSPAFENIRSMWSIIYCEEESLLLLVAVFLKRWDYMHHPCKAGNFH